MSTVASAPRSALHQSLKRRLALRDAQRCEDATTPRCACRCRGRLHGAKRGSVLALDASDPHRPAARCRWRMDNGGLCGRPTAFPAHKGTAHYCVRHSQTSIESAAGLVD